MKIVWRAKARRWAQLLAFCLAIAGAQYGFAPERGFAVPLVYSMCIGTLTWAVVDFGRHLFPSSEETGWPAGIGGLLLVLGGIGVGYGVGNALADPLCLWLGLYPQPRIAEASGIRRSSLLISVLAGVAGTYWFYSRARGAWLHNRMKEAHQQAGEARLKLLEAQLEPHMLFNTLANLRALIATDPARAEQMLDGLIAYLRATLNASRSSTHSLAAEFERLGDYLELMRIRMGPRLTFQMALPPELAQQPVPTLLLQPLVENSIRHGLEPKVAGGSLRVSARREGPTLVLEVSDTGVGLGEAPKPGGGFGLSQVRERLQTLYGSHGRLDLAPTPGGGATVTLRLPLLP